VAEGCGQHTQRAKIRFFQIALASAYELDYLVQLVGDLGILDRSRTHELAEKTLSVKRILIALLRRMRATLVC
jgi:four helix bundle protein